MEHQRLDHKLTDPDYHLDQAPWNPKHALSLLSLSWELNSASRFQGFDGTLFTRLGSCVNLHVKRRLFFNTLVQSAALRQMVHKQQLEIYEVSCPCIISQHTAIYPLN